MIACRQYDRAVASESRARAREDDVEDSHIQVGRVALTNSHKRRMTVKKFCVPHSFRRRGSIADDGWTRDHDNETIVASVEDVEVSYPNF